MPEPSGVPTSTIDRFANEELDKEELIEMVIDLTSNGSRRAALRQELGALNPSELISRASHAGARSAGSIARQAFPPFGLASPAHRMDIQVVLMRTSSGLKKEKLTSRRLSRL